MNLALCLLRECGNIVCILMLFAVVVASAICCCSFIVVASAATCAILAFLLHFVFASSALHQLRFAFQQLIDTSAFSMAHDIKVLNLTASPSLPLSSSFSLSPHPTRCLPCSRSIALNPCAHNWTLPKCVELFAKVAPYFPKHFEMMINSHRQRDSGYSIKCTYNRKIH